MNQAELEQVYEAIARQIDRAGEKRRELFLAKLVLLLAHRNGDAAEVQRCIEDAAQSLDP
ncbi:MAG: hypothetical protein R3F54_13880 [Alphaproteobacteria bacterium]